MFQEAEKAQRFLKIAIYGESGSGKTIWCLSAPGKKAVIDTEGGTNFYGSSFKFDVIHTRSYAAAIKAVKHIKSSPGKYDMLIVDPITNIYQSLKDAGLKIAEARAKRKGKDADAEGLSFREWGLIKLRFQNLISELCNLPCHVIITGWLKDIYDGSSDTPKKIGQTIDSDKKTSYAPDVIIQLCSQRSKRYGIIEKDRTGTYKTGQRIANLKFENFLKAVKGVNNSCELQTEDNSSELDKSELSGINPVALNILNAKKVTKEQAESLDKLADSRGADKAIMLKHYNVKSFEEMTQQQLDNAVSYLSRKKGVKGLLCRT